MSKIDHPDIQPGVWQVYKTLANGWVMWVMLTTTGTYRYKTVKTAL